MAEPKQKASTSEALTRNVRVQVEAQYVTPQFVPGQSQPLQNEWVFAYTVRITNEGDETVQLLSRHWIITDATGHIEEVRGPGVIGQQPVIEPGEELTYTSGASLDTSFGTMEGTYRMVTGGGQEFDVAIAKFTLSEPYTVH